MAEKTSTELARDVRLLFQKGNDALIRENYDYAVDLFNQVLAKEPGLHECRRALRVAQTKKAGKGGGVFRKFLSTAGSSPLVAKGQLALRRDPAEALQIAEQILNSDPTNSGAHRIIVEAADVMEMPRTKVMSLETLVRNHPKDKAVAIEYARALAEIGEAEGAESFLAEFVRSAPYDNDLLQALKDISAKKTLDEKGYQAVASGEGTYRDILKDEKEAVHLEQEGRVQKAEDHAQSLINEYETRLKTEPANPKLLRNLAELYTEKKQFEKALQFYARIKGSEAGASDPTLDAGIAKTKVRQFEHQIEQLDQTAPDYADAVARLNAEKLDFQASECRKRVERFPTDLGIRFEMGVLCFQAGKIGEAIQEFQKAQGNPHKRLAAMNYLAQCFSKRKMFDLAAKTLQNAIKEKPVFDEEKKELIYNLGSVLESMGRKEEAIEQFKLIYEVDIGYRDVAKKVDDYYAGQ